MPMSEIRFRRPPVQITRIENGDLQPRRGLAGCGVPAVDEPWADVGSELDLEDRELLPPLLARLRPRDARRLHCAAKRTSERESPPYNAQVASSFPPLDCNAPGALLRSPLGRFLDFITPSSSARIDAGGLMHGVEPYQLACIQSQEHAILAAAVALWRFGFDAEELHRQPRQLAMEMCIRTETDWCASGELQRHTESGGKANTTPYGAETPPAPVDQHALAPDPRPRPGGKGLGASERIPAPQRREGQGGSSQDKAGGSPRVVRSILEVAAARGCSGPRPPAPFPRADHLQRFVGNMLTQSSHLGGPVKGYSIRCTTGF